MLSVECSEGRARTGQFAAINGTALGNGKQFSPDYSATNLTLNVTAPSTPAQGTHAAPIPALPDSDGDGIPNAQELLAPFNQFDCAQDTHSAQGNGGTDRLECREDLTANQWSILFDHNPRTLIDARGTTRPKCFYRVVITASQPPGACFERRRLKRLAKANAGRTRHGPLCNAAIPSWTSVRAFA